MSGDVACLDIAPVPEKGQRSCFLVVGSYDNTIRILSLDPDDDCMQVLNVQSVTAAPELLLFLGPGFCWCERNKVDTRTSPLSYAGLQNGSSSGL
ncbi:spliceosome-associated protein 130 A [Tanacetum coccineum]